MGKYKILTACFAVFVVAAMLLPVATPAKAYVLSWGQDQFWIDGTMKSKNVQADIYIDAVFQTLPAQANIVVDGVEYTLTIENIIFGEDDPSTTIYDPAGIGFDLGNNGHLHAQVSGIALYARPAPSLPAQWVPVVGYSLEDFGGVLKIAGKNFTPVGLDGWYINMSYWPGSSQDPA